MATLSPIYRHALRSLYPLIVLASVSAGSVIALHETVLTQSESRLAAAEQAYTSARVAHTRRMAMQRHQRLLRLRQKELDQVWATLPTQPQFPTLAVAITELAKANRVSIPGMTHTIQPGKDGALSKGTLTFTATGDFTRIYQFIQRLETADSYIVIETLDAARSLNAATQATPVVDLHMTVSTFLQPEPVRANES